MDRLPIDLTLQEIADIFSGQVMGSTDTRIEGLSTLELAQPGDLAFFSMSRYSSQLHSTQASAVIVSQKLIHLCPERIRKIVYPNPLEAFMKLIRRLAPSDNPYAHSEIMADEKGRSISKMADVSEAAQIASYVFVGAHAKVGAGTFVGPNVVIGPYAEVGRDCYIHPGCVIGPHCIIGNGVILQPGVVVGSDGFGYYQEGGVHVKIPHLGAVVIEDDVEIGANTAIDRAVLGNTLIQKGVKIDNLVQIAHNVKIGNGALIVAQTGIAGSSQVGNYAVLGGQVGVVGHIRVGDGVRMAAGSALSKSIEKKGDYAGRPAMPIDVWRKSIVAVRYLTDNIKEIMKDIKHGKRTK